MVEPCICPARSPDIPEAATAAGPGRSSDSLTETVKTLPGTCFLLPHGAPGPVLRWIGVGCGGLCCICTPIPCTSSSPGPSDADLPFSPSRKNGDPRVSPEICKCL